MQADAFTIQVDTFAIRADAFTMQVDAFTIRADAFAMQVDGFTIRADAFTMQVDTFAIRADAFAILIHEKYNTESNPEIYARFHFMKGRNTTDRLQLGISQLN